MTRTVLKTLAMIVVALSVAVPAKAAPDAVAYELQERCGKRASEVFHRKFSDQRKADTLLDYQSNYSALYNKCYMMVITITFSSSKVDGKMHQYDTRYMIDVNTNAGVGSFVTDTAMSIPMTCKVQQTVCKSKEEWIGLASKFMGDIPE
jgi:hypothetical protein